MKSKNFRHQSRKLPTVSCIICGNLELHTDLFTVFLMAELGISYSKNYSQRVFLLVMINIQWVINILKDLKKKNLWCEKSNLKKGRHVCLTA